MTELLNKVTTFTGDPIPVECKHDHKLQGTGAVFFQSVGLLQCSHCGGWQIIRKPVK